MKDSLGKLDKVPRQGLRWPDQAEITTQIHQAQASSQPLQLANGLSNLRPVSINTPKPVTLVGITNKIVGTNKSVTISFLTNPSDPNFQKVNVHLRLGNGLPVLVAAGTTSPITITVARTRQPATIFLQAEGNWGPHPIQNSPSRALSLM